MACNINWWDPCAVVKDSRCVPSMIVLSLVYYTEDFTLKSPKVTVNKELQELVSLKISQKLTENFQIQNYGGLEIYYNTNITLAILYIFFTNNAFTKT